MYAICKALQLHRTVWVGGWGVQLWSGCERAPLLNCSAFINSIGCVGWCVCTTFSGCVYMNEHLSVSLMSYSIRSSVLCVQLIARIWAGAYVFLSLAICSMALHTNVPLASLTNTQQCTHKLALFYNKLHFLSMTVLSWRHFQISKNLKSKKKKKPNWLYMWHFLYFFKEVHYQYFCLLLFL